MPYSSLNRLTRRAVLGAGLFAGTSFFLKACRGSDSASSADGGDTLSGEVIATTYPGLFEEAHRTIVIPQLQKNADAQVVLVPMLANDQVAKLKAAPNNPPFDVSILDEGPFKAAPKAEIFQQFPSNLSNNYSNLSPVFQNSDGWGPTVSVTGIGIGYNTEQIKTPPTAWSDLWKPEYAGQVGLVTMNSSLGTAFMVEVAKHLGNGSEGNIDAAFAKIQELLPNVAAVASSPGELATLMQQGEVGIAPQYMNSMFALQDKGLPIDWIIPEGGSVGVLASMHVVKEPQTSLELVAAYVDAMISEEVQTTLAQAPYYFGPTNKNVNLSGLLAQKFSDSTDGFLEKLVFLDWQTINESRSAWIERFTKEVVA